ncbi:maleylpyruvate isomerase family mycothiol-dependent enzyme [Streptomyces sp. NBC_01142]|uniref:maleylpyruvate isomerase family mycothiol-dependent enzyme n=1 Tax=Streptomyces sp. NBC_01142 TaxID=2975865 RepID=UPI00225A653F|nr:maleylpyruvate isomerase family mycothiol-dependent enzyme [Streptomyces sp. NBC_01142]MCX4821160.1 maleylpyruvate isomerase family mycothiol-dependent enzyme [Streptomyces sp. NBC_01142]
MDYVPQFHREILAFEAAVRRAAQSDSAPMVPSCPEWSVSDLAAHLGGVHRFVSRIIEDRLLEPPDTTDLTLFALPADLQGWPVPANAPNRGPVPVCLTDWFADGARALASLFRDCDPGERVWTWSREQTTGFWLRMQTIEAAVHRWDAENAVGAAQPVEAELAADAVGQTFEVMAPARRADKNAPPASGERFRISQSDGPGIWTAEFEGDGVRLTASAEPCDVEVTGTASDLMLYLWHRIPADRLEVAGDRELFDRYFTLVPPM